LSKYLYAYRKTYVINNFEELPRPANAVKSAKVSAKTTAQCDRCKNRKLAVDYCIDCEEKICSLHMKVKDCGPLFC